jgi:transcription initiation factor TFIIIB Brf1 subunit/transcription initiation factor TFIIB
MNGPSAGRNGVHPGLFDEARGYKIEQVRMVHPDGTEEWVHRRREDESAHDCAECGSENCIRPDPVNGSYVCIKCGDVKRDRIMASMPERDKGGDVGDLAHEDPSRSRKKVEFSKRSRGESLVSTMVGNENTHREVEGKRKPIYFVWRADEVIRKILSLELFGSDVYASTVAEMASAFDLQKRNQIYMEAIKYPRCLWYLLRRAMEAHFYAAASIYIACLRFSFPMSIRHVAMCLHHVDRESKWGGVRFMERKITNCVNSLTSDDRFPQLKVPYMHGVLQILKTLAWLPTLPRPLPVVARNASGKPNLTRFEQRLPDMSMVERARYRPVVSRSKYNAFVNECREVLSMYVRLTKREVDEMRQQVARAQLQGRAANVDQKKLSEVLAHQYHGKARRTRNTPGVKLDTYTPNATRLAIALFVYVARRGNNQTKYGIDFLWRSFNFKTCQLVRLRTHIDSVLRRHGRENVGLTRATKTEELSYMVNVARRAAAAAIRAADEESAYDSLIAENNKGNTAGESSTEEDDDDEEMDDEDAQQQQLRQQMMKDFPRDETLQMLLDAGMTVTVSSKKTKKRKVNTEPGGDMTSRTPPGPDKKRRRVVKVKQAKEERNRKKQLLLRVARKIDDLHEVVVNS